MGFSSPETVIEVVVVELLEQGFERLLDHIKVHDPARLGVYLALDGDPHMVGVAVQTRTLVPLRDLGQSDVRPQTGNLCTAPSQSLIVEGGNFAAILHALRRAAMPENDA